MSEYLKFGTPLIVVVLAYIGCNDPLLSDNDSHNVSTFDVYIYSDVDSIKDSNKILYVNQQNKGVLPYGKKPSKCVRETDIELPHGEHIIVAKDSITGRTEVKMKLRLEDEQGSHTTDVTMKKGEGTQITPQLDTKSYDPDSCEVLKLYSK